MLQTSIIGILYALSLWSATNAENITSDSYFYGQSPPVYPSRAYYSPRLETCY